MTTLTAFHGIDSPASCDELVAVSELLTAEVIATN